jgi:hypothetical protein
MDGRVTRFRKGSLPRNKNSRISISIDRPVAAGTLFVRELPLDRWILASSCTSPAFLVESLENCLGAKISSMTSKNNLRSRLRLAALEEATALVGHRCRAQLFFSPLSIPLPQEAGLFDDNFVLLFLIQLARLQSKIENLKCCQCIPVLKKNCRKMKATS